MDIKKEDWFVYILECADGSFYTGITKDINLRISAHEQGKGAKYTKGRSPFKIIYKEIHPTRSSASKREAQIKSLNKLAKLQLIRS